MTHSKGPNLKRIKFDSEFDRKKLFDLINGNSEMRRFLPDGVIYKRLDRSFLCAVNNF